MTNAIAALSNAISVLYIVRGKKEITNVFIDTSFDDLHIFHFENGHVGMNGLIRESAPANELVAKLSNATY